MTLDDVLTFAQVVLLLGIVGVIASYQPDKQTRYRASVSIGAAAFAGICLALVVWTMATLNTSCQPASPAWTLFTACVFVAVARTGGNVAKLLPRLKWTHHT
jgi:cytochrome bd-type quinol oxidase subunit 2